MLISGGLGAAAGPASSSPPGASSPNAAVPPATIARATINNSRQTLRAGLNVCEGKVTHREVADALGHPFHAPAPLLAA